MRDLVAIEKEGLELAAECVQEINAAAARAAQLEGIADFSANIVIADDAYLWELNRQFRGIDRATDVLSFPANDLQGPIGEALKEGLEPELGEEGELFLGDIFISIEHAADQAREYGNTLTQELCFLAVHGMLHLMGYDHMQEQEEQVMRQKQREALGRN
ncbi:rRNA maturation RNase YbeY [Christensenellaceae bacterium 44-20]